MSLNFNMFLIYKKQPKELKNIALRVLDEDDG